ncbi:MAG: phosphatase PAP2 family protein [Filifactoraceae bacterium]
MEVTILQKIGIMHTDSLNFFFNMITRLGDKGIVWIILAVILLLKKNTRKYGYMIIITLIVNLIIGEGIIKHLVNRPRPYDVYNFDMVIKKLPATSSFPSGHTASSFAVLGVYLFYVKKYRIPIFVLASLIAISRLYLQVHYPSDILAGIILGLSVSYFTVKTLKEVFNHEC